MVTTLQVDSLGRYAVIERFNVEHSPFTLLLITSNNNNTDKARFSGLKTQRS